MNEVVTSYAEVPNQSVTADGVTFVYRDLGPKNGIPVVLLVHLAAVLDNWDPRVVDGIAAKRRVIAFDNRGEAAATAIVEAGYDVVGTRRNTSGTTPREGVTDVDLDLELDV